MTPTRNRAAAAGAERRRPPNDDDPPERRDASPESESEREAEPVDAASTTAASRRFAAMRASCALAASRADLGGSARAREDGEREEEKTAARRWCASYISRRALSRNASSRSAASLRRAIASEPEPEVPEPEPEPELESPTGSPSSPFFDDPGAASPGASASPPVAPPSIAMPPPLGKNNPPSRPPSIARRYASRDSFPGLGGSGAESAYVLATAAARRTATSSRATNAALAAAVPEAEANQRSWPETVRSARERDSRKSEVESEVSSEDDERRGGEEGEGVDDFASAFASDDSAFASDDFAFASASASASASIFASGADKNSPPPRAGLFAAVGVALRYSSYSFSLSVASTAIFAAAFLAANAASVFSNAPVAVERSTTARVGFLRFASIVSASFTAPYTAAPPRTATAGSAPRTAAKEDEAASAAAATEAAAAAAAAAAARERASATSATSATGSPRARRRWRRRNRFGSRRRRRFAARRRRRRRGRPGGSSTGAMIPTFRRVFR